jgi:hypothetical protein
MGFRLGCYLQRVAYMFLCTHAANDNTHIKHHAVSNCLFSSNCFMGRDCSTGTPTSHCTRHTYLCTHINKKIDVVTSNIVPHASSERVCVCMMNVASIIGIRKFIYLMFVIVGSGCDYSMQHMVETVHSVIRFDAHADRDESRRQQTVQPDQHLPSD